MLGGPGRGAARPYLCRPSLEQAELLVPLRPRRAAAGSMRRYHDDRSWKQRGVVLAGQLLGQFGVLDRAPGERHDLPSFVRIEQLGAMLGESELVPAIGLGPRRRNRKPVIQLLRPNGETVGFAKVGWSPFTTELITNEARWLRHVDGRMPPGTSAPPVLLDHRFDDIHIVVTAPVDTPVFARRRGPLDFETLAAIARLGTDEIRALPNSRCSLRRELGVAEVVDLDRLVERHAEVRIELGLWHGDLTPWNTATNGTSTGIWDWEFSDDHRPIGFDALHIAFELVRRSGPAQEAAAIAAIESDAASILTPVADPVTAAAITDLYFCELLMRERRLAGEGWEPQHLAPLEQHLIDVLQRRIGHP
ncbi:MAG: hypothetical protein R2710_30415 [Acidimicrobiales bacterium]